MEIRIVASRGGEDGPLRSPFGGELALKIEADLAKCQGYVCCVMAAPEVFDIDDDTAKVVLLAPQPGEPLRARVEEAVRSCPSGALRISGA